MGMQQGSTTTTQSSTPFNSSQILDYQNRAVNLANNNPIEYYPGQTYAPPSDYYNYLLGQSSGWGGNAGDQTAPYAYLSQTGGLQSNNAMSSGEGDWFNSLAGISGSNNPLASIANGAYFNSAQPYFAALTDVTRGPAAQSLGATAGGAFLGSNPYLDATFNHASDSVMNRYMAATAPQASSEMERAGRYNSGATSNAQSINQQNLGDTLSGLGAQIYAPAYESERNRMTQAAAALGTMDINAINAALQGYNQQSAIGEKAASDFSTQGNIAANTALGAINKANQLVPSLSGLTSADYATGMSSQATMQQQQQQALMDLMQRFYGQQSAPWSTAQQEAGLIGGAIPGTTTSKQPYFYNPLSQGLGTALGILSLFA